MPTRQPQFGPFDYAASSADIGEWNDELPVRAPLVEIPRSDRARALDGFLSPRLISIRGLIGANGGSDDTTFRDLVDAFRWAHRPGQRDLYLWADRYLKHAQVESCTVGDWEGLAHVPYQVRFRCPDPYWYDAGALQSDTWNPWPLPTAPNGTVASSGGSLASGTYWVRVSWGAGGSETRPGYVEDFAVLSPASKITVTPPTVPTGVTHYYVYAAVTALGGSVPQTDAEYFLQHPLPIAVADPFVLTALLTSGASGLTPGGESRPLTNAGGATALPLVSITVGTTGTAELLVSNDAAPSPAGPLKIVGEVDAGDVLLIDGDAQRVYLNSQEKMSYVESGAFFPLQPGSNGLRIAYAGVTSLTSVVTSFRKRWL